MLTRKRIQQVTWAGIFSLALGVLAPLPSFAITVNQVPNPRQVSGGWVTDMANVLRPETEAEINRLISELEAQNGSEIAVVTVPETAPSATPKDFATELFNHWGIGKQAQDNGVLLLISQGDRRVEIETGYGVEGVLPDARVGNIIEREITPRFRQGDFDGGILAGTQALVVVLRNEEAAPGQPAVQESPGGGLWYWLAGLGGGTALLVSMGYKSLRRPTLLEPEGRSRTNSFWESWRPVHCARCQSVMQKLDFPKIESYLNEREQVAHNLGSVEFVGWQCPQGHEPMAEPKFHIRGYVSNSDEFAQCPTCQELTVTRTSKILQHPTTYRDGRRLITYQCHFCSYHHEVEELIPRLPPPPPPSSGSWSGGSSSGSSGGGGGGSFGGGSSGGGGAGGSW